MSDARLMERRGARVLAASMGLLIAACAGSGPPLEVGDKPIGRESSPSTTVCREWTDGIMDRGSLGINALVNIADAGVVATVTKVGAARWNSTDGAKWCPPPGPVSPIVYRDVTVRIDRALFSSEGVRARPNDEIVVRTLGDGSATGPVELARADGTAIHRNQMSGRFEEGLKVLLLLAAWPTFPTETGDASVVQVVAGWEGNWALDEARDRAESADHARSVPYGQLVARIQQERTAGRQPQRDPGTEVNPLG